MSGNNPRLIAPRDGIYVLSARQIWGNSGAKKAMGLCTDINDGMKGVMLWQDVWQGTAFGSVSTVQYLTAGTTLYPWTWCGRDDSYMSPLERNMPSEYSITLLHEVTFRGV